MFDHKRHHGEKVETMALFLLAPCHVEDLAIIESLIATSYTSPPQLSWLKLRTNHAKLFANIRLESIPPEKSAHCLFLNAS